MTTKLDLGSFMREALVEAKRAGALSEVPIGAVAVVGGEIVARAHNLREATQDPLGHAELLLLRALSGRSQTWRLTDVTIFITCEPCLMCMGALIQARIPKLIYGCKDPKAGACGSLYDLSQDDRLNHRIQVIPEVLEEECREILTNFFRQLR